MHAPDRDADLSTDRFARLLTLSRAPFPASTKTALVGSRPDLRVPMRDVALSNGEVVSLYDTSGPYTDPAVDIDVRRGLPDLRGASVRERGDT
jgi:phosphomethylpyrimidine synthase